MTIEKENEILSKLENLEKDVQEIKTRRRIDEAVAKAVSNNADKWRTRLYIILRHVVSPALAALLTYWAMKWFGYRS